MFNWCHPAASVTFPAAWKLDASRFADIRIIKIGEENTCAAMRQTSGAQELRLTS
jgi:hypothetical protein